MQKHLHSSHTQTPTDTYKSSIPTCLSDELHLLRITGKNVTPTHECKKRTRSYVQLDILAITSAVLKFSSLPYQMRSTHKHTQVSNKRLPSKHTSHHHCTYLRQPL